MSIASKIGWNIEGFDLGNRRDAIISELKSYRANWHLCLGDERLALDLLLHTNNGVILRFFDPFNEYGRISDFDNQLWQLHSPREIVQWVQSNKPYLIGVSNLVLSVGNNEPTTPAHKIPEFLRWCIDLMHAGKQAGIRFAIAEIASAKTVYHDQVEDGVWDEFLRVADSYRGFHILTCHEYTTGILPAQSLPGYPLNLDEPNVIHHNNWSQAKLTLDKIDGNYHIGRFALVTHVRAKQIGLQPLPFVVTECAFDWMADIYTTDDRKRTIDQLKARFNMPNHDFMRGSTGHKLYHEWVMRETGFQGDWNDYLFAQYKWLVNAYPSECEGLNIFALNNDWDLPEGHDMGQPRNDKFRQLVIKNPVGDTMTTPTPEPIVFNPPLYDADVYVTNGYWNLRAGMNATSTDLGDIEGIDSKLRMKVSKVTNPSGQLNWYKYNRELATGIEAGYFADVDKLRIEYVTDEIIDDTPTDTPDDTSTPNVDLDALKSAVLGEILTELSKQVLIDVPLPNFTFTVPNIMRPYLVSYHRNLAAYHSALAQRFEDGTPTTSQIAAQIFDTSTTFSTPLDDYLAQNMSDLADGNDMILDAILNSDNVIADDDVEDEAA